MHKLAKDGYLFVTWANHHYTDFAMSWVTRLKKLGLSNYMVGAMDEDILATLARRAIPTFSMQSGEGQDRARQCSRAREHAAVCFGWMGLGGGGCQQQAGPVLGELLLGDKHCSCSS